MTGCTRELAVGRIVKQQAAEMVELGAEIVAVAHALQIGGVDAVGLEDRIELVEAAEAVVAFDRDVPAEAPPRRERELAFCLNGSRASPGRRLRALSRPVDARKLDIVLAVGKPMAPVALPQHAVVCEVRAGAA